MKIISGKFSGIPLKAPKGKNTRPTSAKTRESVFNIIRTALPGAVCVDCYAGTGAMGFEALSNEADKAYFIDVETAKIIKENAEKLKLAPLKYEILSSDFRPAFNLLAKKGIKADIVFSDPPYNRGIAEMFLKILKISGILKAESITVLEIHRDEYKEIAGTLEEWQVFKEKEYGETRMLFLKLVAEVK
jgi:16S rRNA (guanine(966)-N(2))-methyltransferase RsmD